MEMHKIDLPTRPVVFAFPELEKTTVLEGPHCYMMIGKPGSGKSTIREQILGLYEGMAKHKPYSDHQNITYVSSDDIIEHIAKFVGMTYDGIFTQAASCAQQLVNRQVVEYLKTKRSFIWDQTNLTKGSRQLKIKQIADAGFSIIGICVQCSLDTQRYRCGQRAGKMIPSKVLDDMDHNFEVPELREGFDYMIYKET